MSAFHAAILIVGSLIVAMVMIRWMMRANANERQSMERRRQAWIDEGGNSEDRPNFYSGNGGGGGN